ncbi:MAG: 2-isopropylmalate synthase, partial [Verrucomicrobiaceae bacterium]
LSTDEIRDAFFREFVNIDAPLAVLDYELIHHTTERGQVRCIATIQLDGAKKDIEGLGNGPINAFVHALEEAGMKNFKLTDYRSHAVRGGSDANAAAYVQLQRDDGSLVWGAGVEPSIEMAGLKALVTAWNLLRA